MYNTFGYTDGILNIHTSAERDYQVLKMSRLSKKYIGLNTSQFSREGPKLHEGDISTVNGINQKPTFQEQSFGI